MTLFTSMIWHSLCYDIAGSNEYVSWFVSEDSNAYAVIRGFIVDKHNEIRGFWQRLDK